MPIDNLKDAVKQAREIEPPEPFTGDLDDVLDMSINIMGQRLRDNPDEVPAHVIKDFIKEANRAADRRAAEKANERDRDTKQTSVLELVQDSLLPPERKREIIEHEIVRLREQLVALEGEL